MARSTPGKRMANSKLPSVAAALAQAAWHYKLIRRREREDCFKAFRLNHWMAATLFAGLVLGSAVSP